MNFSRIITETRKKLGLITLAFVFIFSVALGFSFNRIIKLQHNGTCRETRFEVNTDSADKWFYNLKQAEDQRTTLEPNKYFALRQKAFDIRDNELDQIRKTHCDK